MKKVRGLGFWLKRGLLAFGGLVLIAAGALLVLDLPNQPQRFDSQAALSRGDTYKVRIRRDEYGVPHILGPRDADVAFGIAYAHSEDDFATIATVILATRGQLAARDGAKGAVTDYLVQLMRVWPAVNSSYDSLPADLRSVLEGYADGVNYYGAKHPDNLTPGLLPVNGRDVAAGFAFKTPFFYGLDRTLTKLLEPTKAKKVLPVGSNGLAIAPNRSADGATRLLVNSHQPYTGPVPGTRRCWKVARAGTWPAGSSPDHPLCCMVIMRIWAGPIRSMNPISLTSISW